MSDEFKQWNRLYLCRPGPRVESPKWEGPTPWVATVVVTAVLFIALQFCKHVL